MGSKILGIWGAGCLQDRHYGPVSAFCLIWQHRHRGRQCEKFFENANNGCCFLGCLFSHYDNNSSSEIFNCIFTCSNYGCNYNCCIDRSPVSKSKYINEDKTWPSGNKDMSPNDVLLADVPFAHLTNALPMIVHFSLQVALYLGNFQVSAIPT